MLLQLSWLAEEAVCDNLQSTFINFRMTFQPWAMCSTLLGTEMSICNFSSGSAAWRGAASASDCPSWIKFWVWFKFFFFFFFFYAQWSLTVGTFQGKLSVSEGSRMCCTAGALQQVDKRRWCSRLLKIIKNEESSHSLLWWINKTGNIITTYAP